MTHRPTHFVYAVDGEGEKATWTRIGAAWPHKNNDGFNVQLVQGVSVSGRFVIRAAKDNGGQK